MEFKTNASFVNDPVGTNISYRLKEKKNVHKSISELYILCTLQYTALNIYTPGSTPLKWCCNTAINEMEPTMATPSILSLKSSQRAAACVENWAFWFEDKRSIFSFWNLYKIWKILTEIYYFKHTQLNIHIVNKICLYVWLY